MPHQPDPDPHPVEPPTGARTQGKPSDQPPSIFRARRGSQPTHTPPLDPNARLEPGTRVAHFVLLRQIGRGGMGEVWEAIDETLQRPVALKFVLPERLDFQSLERFEREARAGGRLAHPNVVRTLAFGREGNLAWLAQELVEGSWTLKDFLDDLRSADAVPPDLYRQVAVLIAQVADGIEAAHAAGVIHRDIKPQNILIAPDDTPKLADFGLARVRDDSFASMTGDFAGTLSYMSPEQVTAKRIGLDHRTDIFSLGVVLYELLSLRRPFDGDTTQQISLKILFLEPPEPTKIRSQCPRNLSTICGKALAKDPDRRYRTMGEFAADLRRHLANEPILAQPPGALTKMRLWMRRHPTPSVAIGVGSAALVTISALLVQQYQTARELADSNVELAEQTQRAEAGEREATDNAAVARENARAAQVARDEANRRADDVLALSAQKNHDDLVAEAEKLWPPHPVLVPQYEDWLRRAHELIDGRPADDLAGTKSRPGLAEHATKLAELRRGALPVSDEETRIEREAHPSYKKLEPMRTHLLWHSRMLGLEPWPSEADVEAELAREDVPTSTKALDGLAWRLVDPDLPTSGQEVRALLLSRRAVAAAADSQRYVARDTLSWTLYKAGRLDEALREAEAARSEPGADTQQSSLPELEKAIAAWRTDELAERHRERDALAAELEALTEVVNERRIYNFADPEQAWWNSQLAKLVADLQALRDPNTGLMGDVLAPPFGWGVAKRHTFAKSLAERSTLGPQAQQLWAEAIAGIEASPMYRGLRIEPQMGLLPLGMDPHSKLWEFAHLPTGEPPIRSANGELLLNEETGLVFVLIPGGTFWMGAQNVNPEGRNYDPEAERNERPAHEVELTPYFLSKYEMTQAQWQRTSAANPSYFKPPGRMAPSLLHPVESVSWSQSLALLSNFGLTLPSEAQWEHGARGGTTTAWWTGQDRESLRGKVNIADQTAKQANAPWPDIADWPDLEDGTVLHSVVGKYAANPFGLHEVAGNVWEWCLDGYDEGFYGRTPPKDPVAVWDNNNNRSRRGGSYDFSAAKARSAMRSFATTEFRVSYVGVRPARALDVSPAPGNSQE